MQATEKIVFENTNGPRRFFTTNKVDRVTVSGRLQSWADIDGSVVGAATPGLHRIGSNWAGEWWKYNQDCSVQDETWLCRLAPGDSAASMLMWGGATAQQESGQYWEYVLSERWRWSIESQGLDMALNPKITGPLISCSGGWFIRFVNSLKQEVATPASLKIQSVQLARGMQDVLLLAIPYPTSTTFNIYNQGADWCGTLWAVRTGFGDRYHFDSAKQLLFIRVTQEASYWPVGQGTFTNLYTPYAFTREGISLYEDTSQSYIRIQATCPSQNCLASPSVSVPPALGTCNPTGSTNSPSVTPSNKSVVASVTPSTSQSPSKSQSTSPSATPSKSTLPSTSPSVSRSKSVVSPSTSQSPSKSVTKSVTRSLSRSRTASRSPGITG
eukprot:g27529.t1